MNALCRRTAMFSVSVVSLLFTLDVSTLDAAGGGAPAAAAIGVVDLGTLGGSTSIARDVNSAGAVVGVSQRAGDGSSRAFRWTATANMIGLGSLGGSNSDAASINDLGQIAGRADLPDGTHHAFVWQPGAGMRDLGTLGGANSEAVAINDLGVVVGMSDMPGGTFPRHAFIWDAVNGIRDLGLGGAVVRDIDDAGQVVGTADNAFVWDPVHGMRDLGALGGSATNAMAISPAGVIAGGVQDVAAGPEIGVVWSPDLTATLVGTLPATTPWTAGCCSNAMDVNDQHVAVGWALVDGDDVSRAFVWDPVRGMRDLGTLGGDDATAYAVNASGVIVGDSLRSDDLQHATMWVLPTDTTPPTVTCTAPAPIFLLHQREANVTATVRDGGSGPVDTSVSGPADTASVGVRTLTLTGFDRAGNRATAACSYSVRYRAVPSFFRGVVDGTGVVNVAVAGRLIGVRWRITDVDGRPVTNLASATVTSIPATADPASRTDPIESYANGPVGLHARGDGIYQYDWSTAPKWAGTTRLLRVDLGEGVIHTALIRFTP